MRVCETDRKSVSYACVLCDYKSVYYGQDIDFVLVRLLTNEKLRNDTYYYCFYILNCLMLFQQAAFTLRNFEVQIGENGKL